MKKTQMNTRGFTLIELLVVIAIIGILSAVILTNLTGARSRGADGAIKASLSSARSQAELFYDTGGAGTTYDAVCTAGTNNISTQVLGAAKNLNSAVVVGTDATAFAYSSTGAAGGAVCHDSATGWAAIVSLRNPVTASSGWCVDSTGQAKEATTLVASDVICD